MVQRGTEQSMETQGASERSSEDIAQQVDSLVAESTALMDQLIENMRNQRMILEKFMRMAPQQQQEGDRGN